MLRFLIIAINRRDTSADVLGALNARSIALSVLLGTHPPALSSAALVRLAEAFGIAPGTMRTALSRMVAHGEVMLDDGRYRLAGALLDRQRAQDLGRRSPTEPWSGEWHQVTAVADARSLTDRRTLRTQMTAHRFGELRPGVWTRPANLSAPEPSDAWMLLTGRPTGMDPAALAGRLWDLSELAAAAAELDTRLAHLQRRTDWSSPSAIPEAFTESAAVVRFLRVEPLLPVALIEARWPANSLRDRYDEVEHRLRVLLRDVLRG